MSEREKGRISTLTLSRNYSFRMEDGPEKEAGSLTTLSYSPRDSIYEADG